MTIEGVDTYMGMKDFMDRNSKSLADAVRESVINISRVVDNGGE